MCVAISGDASANREKSVKTINDVIDSGVAVITVTETAEVLGQGRTATYDAVRRGQLPSIRIGRRVFVPVPGLLRLLDGDLK